METFCENKAFLKKTKLIWQLLREYGTEGRAQVFWALQ